MPFDLVIFDYDGVLVDSLDEVINVGQDYYRFIGHGRMLNKEIVTTLEPMTYEELARSIGLSPDQIEPFSAFVFNRLQKADASIPLGPRKQSPDGNRNREGARTRPCSRPLVAGTMGFLHFPAEGSCFWSCRVSPPSSRSCCVLVFS